ncbi:prevent-host-death family protein [Rhizorhabdus wittichii DC-6]|nr:prevent-host-death family protein [Rhizorhabdus wittichii DC-6]
MAQFSVHDAKTHLSKLIAVALEGGEVVIARGNVPAVRLVPVEPRGQRRFGALKGKIAMDERFDEPLPDEELDGWNFA